MRAHRGFRSAVAGVLALVFRMLRKSLPGRPFRYNSAFRFGRDQAALEGKSVMTAVPTVEPEVQQHRAEELKLQVTGMTCAGCAASIQQALESRTDVTSASVSFAAGLATIHGDVLNPESLVKTIESRGFGATVINAAEGFDDGSAIERQQKANERTWRHRAILGTGLWAPLEIFHWIATATHWHPAWMPWLMFAGALVIIVFAGSGFYRSAWNAARRGTTNMDTLISLGATTAFVYSSAVLFLQLPHPMYFAEAAGLLGIVSLGHWFEARASARAGSAVRELLQMQPETAEVQRDDGSSRIVASVDIASGTRLIIRPGGRIAVDGIVIEGQSAVDEAIVTGESLPVEKSAGDTVVAGSINTNGHLIVKTTVDGRNTTVARIAALVQKAQTSRAPVQRLADQISSVFVPTVLILALITVLSWWTVGDLSTGIISAVSVLIISCPCALGLATPMAVMVGTGAASKRGILIRSAETLERIGKATHVVFDKTGTLTVGQLEVTEIAAEPPSSVEDVLRFAAAVEAPAEHPIARAIVRESVARGMPISKVIGFLAMPGSGVKGAVDGHEVSVMRDEAATVQVTVDQRRIGTLTLADRLRPDAASAIQSLKDQGIRVAMLSGDKMATALMLGRQLGLDDSQIMGEATPASKAAWIQQQGGCVVMVGDGLNDSAALAASGLGVALATGTNVAMEAAAVVIPGDRVSAVPELLLLSRQTLRTIHQNLVFAFMYNVLAIPLAAFGLLGANGPLVAAAAMGMSDITVIGNALRLRRQLDADRFVPRDVAD